MSVIVDGSNGLVFNDASTQTTAATGFGFKNRIINGAMVIDQRATAVTTSNWTVDRFYYNTNVASKGTAQQSTSVYPTGYKASLGFTSSSAYSVGVSDYFGFQQPIEGLNVVDLAWGTASAATITISFWVYSSLTGTFGGSLRNSAVNRSYVFSYAINSANTWEQKTITIVGDTSGTWLTTNGVGIFVHFAIAAGSNNLGTAGSWSGSNYVGPTGQTSVVGTSGATFYITGVQLEKGSTATSFDYRPCGTELQLCQRYFYSNGGEVSYEVPAMVVQWSSTAAYGGGCSYPVNMRATPTFTVSSASHFYINNPVAGAQPTCTAISLYGQSSKNYSFALTFASGGPPNGTTSMFQNSNTTSARLNYSAEL